MNNKPSADLMTVQEVAKMLRVHITTVHAWAHSGIVEAVELPSTGPRKKYRIYRRSIDALFENNTSKKD